MNHEIGFFLTQLLSLIPGLVIIVAAALTLNRKYSVHVLLILLGQVISILASILSKMAISGIIEGFSAGPGNMTFFTGISIGSFIGYIVFIIGLVMLFDDWVKLNFKAGKSTENLIDQNINKN